jgi:hypothetical protein
MGPRSVRNCALGGDDATQVNRTPRNDERINRVYFFTIGQRDSSSDWNASLPGMVASSL